MTRADLAVEKSAQRLQQLADRAASRGDGVGEWLAEELASDAAFLRKLQPSLIAARVRGQAPANQEPLSAPSSPQLGARPKKRKRGGNGPTRLLIVGAALVAGVLAAKMIDWRGHAHPRD
jgi:hypothetical protein